MPRDNMKDPINIASTQDAATTATSGKSGFAPTGLVKEEGVNNSRENIFQRVGNFLGSAQDFATKPEQSVMEGIQSGRNRPMGASENQQFESHPGYPSSGFSGKSKQSKDDMCSYESKQYFECLKSHGQSQKWCQDDYDNLKQCESKYGK